LILDTLVMTEFNAWAPAGILTKKQSLRPVPRHLPVSFCFTLNAHYSMISYHIVY